MEYVFNRLYERDSNMTYRVEIDGISKRVDTEAEAIEYAKKGYNVTQINSMIIRNGKLEIVPEFVSGATTGKAASVEADNTPRRD